MITAHYDHIGIIDGKIHNGADDNASGTSGILEIANAFQTAKNLGLDFMNTTQVILLKVFIVVAILFLVELKTASMTYLKYSYINTKVGTIFKYQQEDGMKKTFKN